MNRQELRGEVMRRLGKRTLVWAGIRGDDVESLADLDQLRAAYSIIAGYRKRAGIDGIALEDATGRRVDLEVWDIDDHRQDQAVVNFRRSLLRTLGVASAMVPYRPSRFLSAIWFARRDRCLHLGLFGAHQFAFEHKPWVETAVDALGVPIIPWVYVADEEQLQTTELLDRGPVVLRRSRTSGGEGIYRVETAADLERLWPESEEAFVSVAPFMDDTTPINVGGTVWLDGVTVHYPSVQLIGIENCVTRPFGYCGNDFFAVQRLNDSVIDAIEAYTTKIGAWLRNHGYLGTFGVDYMLERDGTLRFTEVNPRFQGSTAASGRVAVDSDQACLPLEHLAAHLGVLMPTQAPLSVRVREMAPVSQIIVHWTGNKSANVDPKPLTDFVIERDGFADIVARPDLSVDPGAAAVRLTVPECVTRSGFEIVEPYGAAIQEWQQSMQVRKYAGKRM